MWSFARLWRRRSSGLSAPGAPREAGEGEWLGGWVLGGWVAGRLGAPDALQCGAAVHASRAPPAPARSGPAPSCSASLPLQPSCATSPPASSPPSGTRSPAVGSSTVSELWIVPGFIHYRILQIAIQFGNWQCIRVTGTNLRIVYFVNTRDASSPKRRKLSECPKRFRKDRFYEVTRRRGGVELFSVRTASSPAQSPVSCLLGHVCWVAPEAGDGISPLVLPEDRSSRKGFLRELCLGWTPQRDDGCEVPAGRRIVYANINNVPVNVYTLQSPRAPLPNISYCGNCLLLWIYHIIPHEPSISKTDLRLTVEITKNKLSFLSLFRIVNFSNNDFPPRQKYSSVSMFNLFSFLANL